MKRITTFLAIIAGAVNFCIADDNIRIMTKDLSVVTNPEITATVQFDYSNMMIEGRPYVDYLESQGIGYENDWQHTITYAEEYFIKCWNKDNKNGMKVSRNDGQEYIMAIVFEKMNPGNAKLALWVGCGAGGASMDGKLLIYKSDDMSNPVFYIDIYGQTGDSGMRLSKDKKRIGSLYGELAEDLVIEIKREIKNAK